MTSVLYKLVDAMKLALLTIATVLAVGSLSGCADADTTTTATSDAPDTFVSPYLMVAVQGSGADTLLIPGLASSASVWDTTVPALDARTHVVQVAGFGGAPPPENLPDDLIATIAGELATYLDGDGSESVRVVGHSMGGILALELARLRPDTIESVVVVDALPYYPVLFSPNATPETYAPTANAMVAQMRAMPDDAYANMQAQNVAIYSKTPKALARIREDAAGSDRDTVTRAMSALLTTDLRPALEVIAQPVTVIHATDPAMGLADGAMRALNEREYAGLADVNIVTISDSYHFIMDDKPQAFQAALSTALEASR